MSGANILIDTNIVIHLLNGDKVLAELLQNKKAHISYITRMELLSYPSITKKEMRSIQVFLDDCLVINMNAKVEKRAIEIRREYNIKLPDSIILASAEYMDIPFITADKQLNRVEEVRTLIYEL